MRIAFLLSEFPAISETFVLSQITGLLSMGQHVEVFAGRRRNELMTHPAFEDFELNDLTHYGWHMPRPIGRRVWTGLRLLKDRLGRSDLKSLRLLNPLRVGLRQACSLNLFFKGSALFDASSFDIVHAHFGWNGQLAAQLKALGLLDAKLVTTFHGADMSVESPLLAQKYAALFRLGDLFLPVSRRWRDRLIEFGSPEEKTIVHHVGVDCTDFAFKARTPGERLRILMVGRFVEKKGLEYGIKAVGSLLRQGIPLVLTIVGSGPLGSRLKHIATRERLDADTHWLGTQDARVVRRAMYESDVLLAPSITALNGDQEGIPVVLMEAMATGMLVVSTRHSGIPELVSDGESGFLVNPRDVLGLAQCLKRIWRNPPLWRRFGEAGRRRVERDYNAETQHRILLELYGDLVAERRISLSVATGAAPREDSKLHGPRPQAKAPQRSGNLKICFFLSEFPVVSETFILNQITGLMDLGHRVDLLAIARKDDNVFHPSVLEYKLMDRVEYLPSPGRTYYSRACRGIERLLRLSASDPAAARRMVKLLRSPFDAHRVVDCLLLAQKIAVLNDYDVVHCHFATSGAVLAPWKAFSRFRTPFLTSFHGYDVNLHEYRLRPGFYRTLFEQGDAFSANTRFTAQRAQELGCPPERTFILPMSIDTRHAVFRERHIAPGESTRILTVGRFVAKKGIEYGLRAVADLLRKGLPIEYVLVGDGRLRGQLEQLVDDLGIRRAVRFTGYLSDLELDKEYDKSHIFLLPSVTASNGDMEGQALVLQEAQARGIPVVSTRHNGIPEGVAEGKSAILVPERDHFALARTIESLIEDHDCWPAMGRAGRQLVEECFKQELLIKSLESLYRRIIASTIPDSGRPSDVPGVGEGHHA